MKSRMARLGTIVAALAAAAAFAAGSPANAAVINHAVPDNGGYPPVSDDFSIWLTGDPNPQMPFVCTSQTIYLTRGDYFWSMFPTGKAVDVYLDSSNYSWGDCIIPENGYYIQSSELCPLNLPPAYGCVNMTDRYTLESGTYLVGSLLNWLQLNP